MNNGHMRMQLFAIVLVLAIGIAGFVHAFPLGWSNDNQVLPTLTNFTGPDFVIDQSDYIYIGYIENGQVYYAKLNRQGTVIEGPFQVTAFSGPTLIHSATIRVDGFGNKHLIWNKIQTGIGLPTLNHVMYAKMNQQNNIIISPIQISDGNYDSDQASITIDTVGSAHIFWRDNRDLNGTNNREIYYSKINDSGIINPSQLRITYSPESSEQAKLLTQSNNSVVADLFWLEDTQLKSIKFDMNNGSIIPFVQRIDYNTNGGAYNYQAARDGYNHINLVWVYYPFYVLHKKVDGNGNDLSPPAIVNLNLNNYNMHVYGIAIDSENNVDMLIEGTNTAIGTHNEFVKIDTNQNIIEQLPLLSTNSNRSYYSIQTDSTNQVYLIGVEQINNGSYFTYKPIYKRTLPPIQVSGITQVGQTMQFHISSPTNPNANYGSALALSSTPTIQLGNETIPLANDWLLQACINDPASIGLQNNFGVLDGNGNATVTLNIPNVSLGGPTPVYFAFASFDANGNILSVSKELPFIVQP